MVTSSSWYWQKFIEAPGNPVLLRRGGIGAVVEWGSMPPETTKFVLRAIKETLEAVNCRRARLGLVGINGFPSGDRTGTLTNEIILFRV